MLAQRVTVQISADGTRRRQAVSLVILTHNRGRTSGRADGIVMTPSHNPPDDGGFKITRRTAPAGGV